MNEYITIRMGGTRRVVPKGKLPSLMEVSKMMVTEAIKAGLSEERARELYELQVVTE